MDEKVRQRQALFELREKTLGQILDETVARIPDKEAIVYADRNYRQTWREFADTVDLFAKGLMALGVQKGEKVAVWASNVPYWVTLQFATAKIGAILITVNTNYREHELEYLLNQSECENIFIMDSLRDHDYIDTLYTLAPSCATRAATGSASRACRICGASVSWARRSIAACIPCPRSCPCPS